MEVKKRAYERLADLNVGVCRPLADLTASAIYSAIHRNREEFKKKGWKFRIQKDEEGRPYVCRIT